MCVGEVIGPVSLFNETSTRSTVRDGVQKLYSMLYSSTSLNPNVQPYILRGSYSGLDARRFLDDACFFESNS
jgi:hypothetical protein